MLLNAKLGSRSTSTAIRQSKGIAHWSAKVVNQSQKVDPLAAVNENMPLPWQFKSDDQTVDTREADSVQMVQMAEKQEPTLNELLGELDKEAPMDMSLNDIFAELIAADQKFAKVG